MGITEGLYKLGYAANRLNEGSDHLNGLLAQIDDALGRLNVGMDYTHPRPLLEEVSAGADGKRVITLGYLSYARLNGRHRLVFRTYKVLESRRDSGHEEPGVAVPLLDAPRIIRHEAVDLLPDLVGGIVARVEDVLGKLERRRQVAQNVLAQLEEMLATGVEHRRPPTSP